MKVQTFRRAERAVYVLVDGKPVSEHESEDAALLAAANLSAWIDGPDSEAGRAFRGEGTRDRKWESLRALVEKGLRSCVDWGAREAAAMMHRVLGTMASLDLGRRPDAHELNAPDPAHTPAVRRVVAWEAAHSQWGKKHGHPPKAEQVSHAYLDAALALIHRARRWRGKGASGFAISRYFSHGRGRCVPNRRHPRVKRLAAYLRRRDEQAGWR